MVDVNAEKVAMLVILGTNPVFTAPFDVGSNAASGATLRAGLNESGPDERRGAYNADNPLHHVPLIVNHGLYGADVDETAAFAHWHVPASHYMEMWGDIRAHDGTATLIQPLIDPLYTSKSDVELLSFLAGHGEVSGYDAVMDTWRDLYGRAKKAVGADDFDTYWKKSVERGVLLGTARAAENVTPKTAASAMVAAGPSTRPSGGPGLEVNFRPDPAIWDGRYANLAWLQELPKPVTLLTWDTAALMSLKTASLLTPPITPSDEGRATETRTIKITVAGKELSIPAFILPGHVDHSVTIYLGYGRNRAGRVATSAGGSDAYSLMPSSDAWTVSNANVVAQEEFYALATAQSHHLIDIPKGKTSRLDQYWLKERELIHAYTVDEIERAPAEAEPQASTASARLGGLGVNRRIALPIQHEQIDPDRTLLPAWRYEYNKWGMVIDNQACIGCNACVTACQSENNIATVGKEMVLRGRIMLWLRIDTYFDGEAEGNPNVYFQPIPCMHCENAPCTLVCPVEATTISAEGINEMTYNRCVGTRYCSNNCPYKVRRFNFMQWTDYETPQFMLQRNPNVTVRARGVMEKCNYCVQRINNGRIEAKKLDRPIEPGEVITACAQACPTEAISFGNLNDPRWAVTQLQSETLRYTLLDELNTLPRTSYLPVVLNPNPNLPLHLGDAETEPAMPARAS